MAKLIKKDGKYVIKPQNNPEPQEQEVDDKPSREDNVDELIHKLVAYNGGLQIAHWMADTVTNEHKALGELYDSMIALTDDFAEVYMGKYGVMAFVPNIKIEDLGKSPCAKGCDLVYQICENFDEEEDSDLLNILADMKIALNKAKYLLKES